MYKSYKCNNEQKKLDTKNTHYGYIDTKFKIRQNKSMIPEVAVMGSYRKVTEGGPQGFW